MGCGSSAAVQPNPVTEDAPVVESFEKEQPTGTEKVSEDIPTIDLSKIKIGYVLEHEQHSDWYTYTYYLTEDYETGQPLEQPEKKLFCYNKELDIKFESAEWHKIISRAQSIARLAKSRRAKCFKRMRESNRRDFMFDLKYDLDKIHGKFNSEYAIKNNAEWRKYTNNGTQKVLAGIMRDLDPGLAERHLAQFTIGFGRPESTVTEKATVIAKLVFKELEKLYKYPEIYTKEDAPAAYLKMLELIPKDELRELLCRENKRQIQKELYESYKKMLELFGWYGLHPKFKDYSLREFALEKYELRPDEIILINDAIEAAQEKNKLGNLEKIHVPRPTECETEIDSTAI